VEEWLAADPPADGARLELIWGYWHLSPAPSYRHQRATHRLGRVIEDALVAGGRTDLHMFPGAAVEISTPWRTGLIPDDAYTPTLLAHPTSLGVLEAESA
jgi:hypothetical protein